MPRPLRLLIVDDDSHYTALLSLKLSTAFPTMDIQLKHHQKVQKGYDIYILDNDFSGEKWGGTLAEKARALEPAACILILSATLDMSLLKRLVNCHADAVIDKADTCMLQQLAQHIHHHQGIMAAQSVKKQKGLRGALQDVTLLLREWNHKAALKDMREEC